MKYVLFITVLVLSCCELCPTQSKYQKTDPARTITTAVDTTTLSTEMYPVYELFITNQSTVDTLQWRTNNQTAWQTLLPASSGFRSVHVERILANQIFRKAKSGTVISELQAN